MTRFYLIFVSVALAFPTKSLAAEYDYQIVRASGYYEGSPTPMFKGYRSSLLITRLDTGTVWICSGEVEWAKGDMQAARTSCNLVGTLPTRSNTQKVLVPYGGHASREQIVVDQGGGRKFAYSNAERAFWIVNAQTHKPRFCGFELSTSNTRLLCSEEPTIPM